MIDIILFVLAGIALLVAAYNDIKTREVPDWVSHGLIYAALGTRLLYAITTNNYSAFINGLLGFGICFAVACAFFYLRQWGGGDAKMLMGIGAVLGFSKILLWFVILLMFVGAAYGVAYSIGLAFTHKKTFMQKYNQYTKQYKKIMQYAFIAILVSLLSFVYFQLADAVLLVTAVSLILFGIILFVFVKSVEESCLLQKLPISKITEGDWIAETIKINGKTVITKNNTGVTQEQLNQLKHYKQVILVKAGVPFIPVFLISFILVITLKDVLIGIL